MSRTALEFGPDAFRAATGVSRETLAVLGRYADLLARWQRRINLVGPATMPDLWRRHFLDSAQLLPLAPSTSGCWLDLGSGAGFPGLVLALLGVADMHLVESDGRKCAFLAEAARVTGARITLHHGRIETLTGVAAAVVTARACAPVARLLALSAGIATRHTVYLLPKGREVAAELTEAGESWSMQIERFPSQTDPRGTVLRLTEVAPCP